MKELSLEEKWRGDPKYIKISVSFSGEHFMQHSKLFYLCVFPLEYCRNGCSWRKPCQHGPLSLSKDKKKCKNKQGKMYSYLTHRQQIRKRAPMPLYNTTTHTHTHTHTHKGFTQNTGLLVGQISILLTPLYM